MTTVVLVHGTGVRKGKYLSTFDRFRSAVGENHPGVMVQPCQWGEGLGVALQAVASLPGQVSGADPERIAEREWQVARWGLLDVDPLHELRMLSVLGESGTGGSAFVASSVPATVIIERAAQLGSDPELSARLREWGLAEAFAAAVPEIVGAAVTQEALHLSSLSDAAPAVSRALIAGTVRHSAAGDEAPVPLIESRREALHQLIVDRLGGADLGGPVAALAKSTAMLAWRWFGSGVVERRRGTLTHATSPVAGDVLHYLTRGERIRRFILENCRAARPPVVVVAHSLGGIASLDLLSMTAVPEIAHLVTVGCQAPFLYEIDALPSLPFGEPLPESVPAWTNVYDRRDLFSYVGAELFPGRVTDVEISSGNPFPFAHSDYFGNPAFYELLADVLEGVGR